GTTVCIIAGRLSATNSFLQILVLEAGSHIQDVDNHIQLGQQFKNLTQTGKSFTFHIGKPSAAVVGCSLVVPAGRCLGGELSVNSMVYTKAAASDYDNWESVYQNLGWGSKDLIPLLKKAKTYQPGSKNDIHGNSEPIKVSYTQENNNVGLQFLEAVSKYNTSRATTNNANDFSTCDAYG
ncbi:hypothetical protein AX16_000697, partial [Volvariella volvacea WC 439]